MWLIILLAVLGLVMWFVFPFVAGLVRIKRHQFHVDQLTKRTVRDMNKAVKDDWRIW